MIKWGEWIWKFDVLALEDGDLLLLAHISHMAEYPLSKSSAFFKPLSICETLAVGMAIITP